MDQKPATLFAYIAFDEASKGILAHGPTATDALCLADQRAPDAPIHILDAGNFGLVIWNERMDLAAAIENLQERFSQVQSPHSQFETYSRRTDPQNFRESKRINEILST